MEEAKRIEAVNQQAVSQFAMGYPFGMFGEMGMMGTLGMQMGQQGQGQQTQGQGQGGQGSSQNQNQNHGQLQSQSQPQPAQSQQQQTTIDPNLTFDPSDYWNFPTAGSSTGPDTVSGTGTGAGNNNNIIAPNYVWPSGFTPESNIPPSDPLEPTMKQFMTSPATDMRLINALENQAAFIQGNPGEDEDLDLFYYRFVSRASYDLLIMLIG